MNFVSPPTNSQKPLNTDGTVEKSWYLFFTQIYGAVSGIINANESLTSIKSDALLDLGIKPDIASLYIFNGVTATWTLPDVVKYTNRIFKIKNRGSGNLTLQRGGTDKIYTNAAVNSVVIAAGGSYTVQSDGVYWLSL